MPFVKVACGKLNHIIRGSPEEALNEQCAGILWNCPAFNVPGCGCYRACWKCNLPGYAVLAVIVCRVDLYARAGDNACLVCKVDCEPHLSGRGNCRASGCCDPENISGFNVDSRASRQ